MARFETAKPATCRWCDCAIWRQLAPYQIETDTFRVQSAIEELTHRLWGRWTYQAHKVGGGFELVPRHPEHLVGNYTEKVILTDHRCTHLPTTTHPDYWPRPEKETPDGLPF